MNWNGIRRDSLDVTNNLGFGLLETNGRHKVDGELRRRRGMARTSLPKKTAAIRGLVGFSKNQSSLNACVLDGANLQGYNQPYALWGDNPAGYPSISGLVVDYSLDGTLVDALGVSDTLVQSVAGTGVQSWTTGPNGIGQAIKISNGDRVYSATVRVAGLLTSNITICGWIRHQKTAPSFPLNSRYIGIGYVGGGSGQLAQSYVVPFGGGDRIVGNLLLGSSMTASSLTDGWTHVACSISGTVAKWFINGVLISTGTDTTVRTVSSVSFTGPGSVALEVCDIRIYNVATADAYIPFLMDR